ncbi:MAG: shikimate kinase, partial [Vicingaceae bacterium]
DKIFLIGFMGSGKTTLAKKLAKKLNYVFLDLDDEIEKVEELSITQIFDEKGGEYFRKLEKETLISLVSTNSQFVLSVGGGTPCFYDNMEVINNAGTSVYLKYNSGILTSRLINAKTKRPLIKGFNEDELKEFIQNKLSEREQYYKQCKFTLSGNNLKVDDLLGIL